MTRLNFMFLVIFGVAIIFSGCEKEDCSTSIFTEFTGTSNFVVDIEPGTTTELPDGRILIDGQSAEWYDEATDWRVTGKTIWHVNWLMEVEANTAQIWGTAELFVDGDRGKWELSWQGYQTPTGDGFKVVVGAVGTGKEGEVKGLVATWTYTMNFDFNNPETSFFYATEGIINE